MIEPNGVFREWMKRYLFEYLIALGLCLAATGFCIPLARAATTGANRALLMAAPVGAILAMSFVVFRHFQRIDEFLRRVMVEAFAMAGAVACVWTLVYAVFELAGFPKISLWWVWGSLVLSWNLWTFGQWAFRR